jgi:hypothetical protein
MDVVVLVRYLLDNPGEVKDVLVNGPVTYLLEQVDEKESEYAMFAICRWVGSLRWHHYNMPPSFDLHQHQSPVKRRTSSVQPVR